jgi:hypothetical protein
MLCVRSAVGYRKCKSYILYMLEEIYIKRGRARERLCVSVSVKIKCYVCIWACATLTNLKLSASYNCKIRSQHRKGNCSNDEESCTVSKNGNFQFMVLY